MSQAKDSDIQTAGKTISGESISSGERNKTSLRVPSEGVALKDRSGSDREDRVIEYNTMSHFNGISIPEELKESDRDSSRSAAEINFSHSKRLILIKHS